MVCLPRIPGFFHAISNPLPMIFWSPTHGIIEPLWYIDPPTHGILNPLLMVLWTPSFGKNEEVQFTMMRFKILWLKFDPWVKIPYGILNLGSIFQGFEKPYDTGLGWVRFYSILISHVNIGFKDHRIPFFFYSGLNRFFCKFIYRTPGCFILS